MSDEDKAKAIDSVVERLRKCMTAAERWEVHADRPTIPSAVFGGDISVSNVETWAITIQHHGFTTPITLLPEPPPDECTVVGS